MIYETFVFVHLVGVVLFFSGFSASFFIKIRAEHTGDPNILAHTYAAINFNDKWFTPLSIALILVGGFGNAVLSGFPVLRTGWIFWSLVLYGAAGMIFVLRALPLQHRLEKLINDGRASGEFDWPGYRTLAKNWTTWASTAFLIVIAIFVLMIFKPTLPTFWS